MKVLYISDSLGTPIHPRGIFNFSVALVEILKGEGASVDLVVEGAADFSLEDRFGALCRDRAGRRQLRAALGDSSLFQPGPVRLSLGLSHAQDQVPGERSRPLHRRLARFSRAHGLSPQHRRAQRSRADRLRAAQERASQSVRQSRRQARLLFLLDVARQSRPAAARDRRLRLRSGDRRHPAFHPHRRHWPRTGS